MSFGHSDAKPPAAGHDDERFGELDPLTDKFVSLADMRRWRNRYLMIVLLPPLVVVCILFILKHMPEKMAVQILEAWVATLAPDRSPGAPAGLQHGALLVGLITIAIPLAMAFAFVRVLQLQRDMMEVQGFAKMTRRVEAERVAAAKRAADIWNGFNRRRGVK